MEIMFLQARAVLYLPSGMKAWMVAMTLALAGAACAEQLAGSGSFECLVPDDWKEIGPVFPGTGLTLISPVPDSLPGMTVPLILFFKETRDPSAEAEPQPAPGEEKTVEIGGVQVIRRDRSVKNVINGETYNCDEITFIRKDGAVREELTITGPVEVFLRSGKTLEKLVASLKVDAAPPGPGRTREVTHTGFRCRVPAGWIRLRTAGMLVCTSREVLEDSGARMSVTFREDNTPGGVRVTTEQARENLFAAQGQKVGEARRMVGVGQGADGPLKRGEIPDARVEIVKVDGVELLKFEATEARTADRTLLMLRTGGLLQLVQKGTREVTFQMPLEMERKYGKEFSEMVASVGLVGEEGAPREAAPVPFRAGTVECMVPADWRITREDGHTVASGPRKRISGVLVGPVVFDFRADVPERTSLSLRAFTMKESREVVEEARRQVGKIPGADGPLKEKEVVDPKVWTETVGGMEMIRSRYTGAKMLGGEPVAVNVEMYLRMVPGGIEGLMTLDPLANSSARAMQKIGASVRAVK